MRYILACLLLSFVCYGAEPSAFERQSGATKKDLSSLQGTAQSLLNLTTQIQQQQETLKQSQEGLMSLYESQHQKLQSTIAQSTTNTQEIENLKSEIAALKTLLEQQSTQIATLDSKMQELHTLTIKTQENILQELEKLSAQSTKGAQKQESKQSQKPQFDKSKSPELFAQAKELIKKKHYKSAKDIMLWLKDNKYNTPETTFYLGEIAYLQKDYHLAIKYYKASVALSDKGAYMPTLLLHTALCFKGIKDMANYNSFLEALIAAYPQSKEAAQAKELKQ
ncbi:tetratricopeptide repeat protein [uncultured Helicobacter sp.]|uniref:tetratricopeptide repeat protein n=1 Tax=uncultured Helicobacter sp. TaxID=175537 RepID=UPI00375193A0